jgi:nucleoid DNA-binding protein
VSGSECKVNEYLQDLETKSQVIECRDEEIKMTKTDLVRAIAQKHDLSVTVAAEILNFALDQVTEVLEQGEPVRLRGFGNFDVKDRPPRKGRSLVTGKSITIPAKRVATFKPGNGLSKRIEMAAAISKGDGQPSVQDNGNEGSQSQQIGKRLIYSHILDIKDCTTFLWRRLKNLKDGDTIINCVVREITYNCVVENLRVLSEAGLFQFEAKNPNSSRENAVLNLRLHDIKPELRKLVQQAILTTS